MKTHYHDKVMQRFRQAGYEVIGYSRNSHKVLLKPPTHTVIVPTKINDKNYAHRILKREGLRL